MKTWILAATVLLVPTAHGAETATSSEVLWDVVEDTPANTQATPPITTPTAPSGTCQNPQVDPNYKNTPLEIRVDQDTQIAKVYLNGKILKIPGERGGSVEFVMYVSTGGGLKIPNGKYDKEPYCAVTPAFEEVVPAMEESAFDPTKCTPEEIHQRATMFPVYYSNTFSDESKNPVPMRNAIRIQKGGGWFLHEVPSSYRKYLGQNVSGECVRMPPYAAKMLYDLTKQYGGLKVKLSGPPQVSRCKPQFCDENFRQQAMRDIQEGRVPRTRYTGSEGLFGDDGAFSRFFCGGDKMRHTEGR